MTQFSNKTELMEWLDGAMEADHMPSQERARSMMSDMLLYEGVQWMLQGSSGRHLRELGKRIDNWNPDRAQLRVTLNFITRMVNESSSQTSPSKMGFEVHPTSLDGDADLAMAASAMQAALEGSLEDAGFLDARRIVNIRRCIVGVYGVMLSTTAKKRTLNIRGKSREVLDSVLRVSPMDPSRLVLDPAVQDRRLDRHEFVMYKDVWSLSKIKRELGVEIDPGKARDFGQILPMHIEMHRLTDGRLFQHYASYSKTKAAMVIQAFVKGESGRFETMPIIVDYGDRNDRIWVNEDDPTNPFGGNGLPMALYHAIPRSESIWSISDVRMLRDAQHLRNIAESYLMRHLQASSSFKFAMDERTLPQGQTPESFSQAIDNQIGGPVFYTSANSSMGRPLGPPSVLTMPVLPPGVMELSSRYEREGSSQVSRTEATRGHIKSHVANATVRDAINQANLPLDRRVEEDLESDKSFAEVVLGTILKSVQQKNPSTMGVLHRLQFTAEDIAALASVDPMDPGVSIVVRESAVRARSHESRRADLTMALQMQAMSPEEFAMTMARDLDSPLSESDRRHQHAALRAAQRVVAGEEWTPAPLGRRGFFYIEAFRDAMTSRAAQANPETRDRLSRAIDAQEQFEVMRAMALNPEPAQQGVQSAGPAQEAAAEPQPMTVDDLMAGSGGAVPA